MKPAFFSKKHTLLSVVFLLLAACMSDLDLNKSPAAAGNIVGKILHHDGTPAHGASIRLLPADYDPYSGFGKNAIDSATLDENGTYAFSVKSPGFFCLIAQGQGAYSYEDSVYGSNNAQNIVKDDTLKSPGSISGIARLRAGDDNRQAIVLALGTTTYAMPQDTSGVFSLPALAEGAYRLRILTLNKGYGSFDTTVSVASGQNTEISRVVRLAFNGVPAIGPVTGKFDSQMMRVTLFWPAFDTTNVESLYVFRNTGIAGQPHAILGRTDTAFNDDVFLLDADSLKYHDTLRYCVAALGKNHTIGKACTVPDILMRGILTPVNRVSLSRFGLSPGELGDYAVDGNHNIYLCGDGWISKVDSNGRVCANYCDDWCAHDSVDLTHLLHNSQIRTDGKGNIYYYCDRTGQLIKLTADLHIQRTRAVMMVKMLVDPKGLVYNFAFNSTTVFDSTLSVLDSTLSGLDSARSDAVCRCGWIFPQQFLDNALFCLNHCPQYNLKIFKMSDIHFSQIQIIDFGEELKKYDPLPFGYVYIDQISFAANGMLVVRAHGNLNQFTSGCDDFFFVFDSNKKLLGRCWLGYKGYSTYVFDGVDRFYFYNEPDQSIDAFKMHWQRQ